VPGGDYHVVPDLEFRSGPYSIEGQVVDQNGNPMSDIVVVCYDESGNMGDVWLTTGTDHAGHFRLSGLPSGGVRLSVGLSGYVGFRDVELLEWL
jgi:hypothetical protein